MKDAWIRWFSSMKTWTLIFGVTLTPSAALLAKYGFQVSDDTVRLLAELMSGGFAVLLAAQGATDHGKEAARLRGSSIEGVGGDVMVMAAPPVVPASPPVEQPKGSVMPSLVLALAMLVLFGGIAACAWFKDEAKHEAHALVDCAAGQLGQTVKELRPLADDVLVEATGGDGQVDFARVENVGKNFASNVGMCLIADAITRALAPAPADPNAPKASSLVADPKSLHAAFDRLRAQRAPGKSYKTESGTL